MQTGIKATIRTLEEVSARAWPALETHIDDGWLLRFSEGYTRRANSVLPVYGSSRDVYRKIADCEAYYRRHGQPAIFKLTPAAAPNDLDAILAAKGYTRSYPAVSVQTCIAAYAHARPDARVQMHADLSDDWLQAYADLNAIHEENRPILQRMLARITTDGVYATIKIDGKVAAIGMGQRADDYMGLFGIVTGADYRRRGLGRAMLNTLMHHAVSAGAQTLFLQVTHDNIPARRLYAQLGFCEVYPYWYRTLAT